MRVAGVVRGFLAVALLAAVAAGCGRPPDETWLRFLGFRAPEGTLGIAVVNGKLLDGGTDSVDAALENASVTVGKAEGGTGILVDRVRVTYRLAGYSPPPTELPVTLYLPAPAKAGESASGTLSALPIVPASLKQWIITSGAPRHPEARLTARVTFFALTDDGNRLEVEGSIPIVLANAGATEGKPTVSIVATVPAAKESPLVAGKFTVTRDGSTAASLAVTYSLAGSTAENGGDYKAIDVNVVIPGGSPDADIVITPIFDGTADVARQVRITLSASSAYSVGSPSSATVTITDD